MASIEYTSSWTKKLVKIEIDDKLMYIILNMAHHNLSSLKKHEKVLPPSEEEAFKIVKKIFGEFQHSVHN